MKTIGSSSNTAVQDVNLLFETDHGTREKVYIFHALDAVAADKVAVDIGNFSVVHGSSSAFVGASAEFVRLVEACFRMRYCKVDPSDDPSGGLRLDGYLSDFHGKPFRILAADSANLTPIIQATPRRFNGKPVAWAFGMDLGGETLKLALVKYGAKEPFVESAVPLRVEGVTYDSEFVKSLVASSVKALIEKAGISLSDIEAIGISFAAAVRDGRASQSKALLDMEDVFGIVNQVFMPAKFEKVRYLESFFRSALSKTVSPNVPIIVMNDGECEVAGEEPGTLLIKAGTTVAGGFQSRNFRTDFLTEVGRCIIDTSDAAPEHRWSRICGSNQVIGSQRLSKQCHGEGITLDGCPITPDKAGHQLAEIIDSALPGAEVVKRLSTEMGGKIADLVVECRKHLGETDRILLRGGLLLNCHPVGRIMRAAAQAKLPPDLAAKIVEETPSRYSGAAAVANLAARAR